MSWNREIYLRSWRCNQITPTIDSSSHSSGNVSIRGWPTLNEDRFISWWLRPISWCLRFMILMRESASVNWKFIGSSANRRQNNRTSVTRLRGHSSSKSYDSSWQLTLNQTQLRFSFLGYWQRNQKKISLGQAGFVCSLHRRLFTITANKMIKPWDNFSSNIFNR